MKTSTRTELLEHSRAKVELFKTYLSTYLNIISRVKHIKKIHIYDLLCGEGVYSDNSEGSPIAILKTIKDHYFSNNKSCPNIDLWLNDNGLSDIESNKSKIQRVKEHSKDIYKPSNLNIQFTEIDYSKIYKSVLDKVESFSEDKHIIFIDPHGYKNIKLSQITQLLNFGNSEVILFLPLFDMYRFANKSYDKNFKGGKSLNSFLNDCFYNKQMNFTTVFDFTEKLKGAFVNHNTKCFVDTFLLEKEKSNYYGLFFFTPNALGFEKMLEAKWKVDTDQGRGFSIRIENQSSLFQVLETSSYPTELITFLKNGHKTNSELYIFGLKKGYLPKHTIEILKPLRKTNKLLVKDLAGIIMPKNGYYLAYENYKTNPVKIVKYFLN
ncbi:three-Cys-motif partner protein TcmP [uncultured Algibacter sp.]|uniref:three-Cys-motif partner protein TcmP n=1 Tax=uncultured Algibacter sp. TaxID=298659 RepID=UPI0026272E25|nr:three-Cys-motif partner protein TcmP [uncultured Algibacter sp.]